MAQWRPGQRAAWDDSGDEPAPRPPLPDLPCFPAMHGYTKLREALDTLNFRHVADALRAPAAAGNTAFGSLPRPDTDDGFRVLDGLWFRGRGTRWARADEEYVRRARDGWLASPDPRALGAAAVADTLGAYLRHHPMGLRRLLLWQLGCLLRDDPAGPTEETAAALGVHRDEAGYVAAAVALGFPDAGPAREAAEHLGDVWPDKRLQRAERTAARVPDTGRDPVLTRLLAELRTQRAEVHRLIDTAARLEAGGSVRAAVKARFAAARRAVDDPALEAGLLAAAARLTDANVSPTGPHLDVLLQEGTVQLTWPPPRPTTSPVTFRLLRFPDGTPWDATELTAPGAGGRKQARTPGQAKPGAEEQTKAGSAGRTQAGTAGQAEPGVEVRARPGAVELTEAGAEEEPGMPLRHVDADAPVGRGLRYALVPLREGVIAGVPLVSGAVVVVPDVAGVKASVVPDGVRLRWRVDPACVAVSVERTREGGGPERVPCEREGLLDVPRAAGDYSYAIRCGYPGPGGETVWSEGVRVGVRAAEWPGQVEDLTARLVGEGERVALTWRPPARGGSAAVAWPSGPVRPGTDVSRRTDLTVPDGPSQPEPFLEVAVPERSRLRMTTVSTLGDRALTGPAVVVERLGTVRDLTVHRIDAGRAAVRFEWPEPAVLVLVVWEGGGRREELRVARSRFLAEGHVVFPVTPDACLVTVSAVPRPDAIAVPADAASAELPALPVPPRLLPPPAPPFTWWGRWRRRWWPYRR